MTDVRQAIGPYRLLELLGQGSMGAVYRGRHRDSAQLAAVKTVLVPRAELLSGIRREVQVLARLSHPGIVRILDEGVDGGVPWYAMELAEGVTLRKWATRLPRPDWGEPGAVLTAAQPLSWWTETLEQDGSNRSNAGPNGAPERNQARESKAGLAASSRDGSTSLSVAFRSRRSRPLASLTSQPGESGSTASLELPTSSMGKAQPSPSHSGRPGFDGTGLESILTLVRQICAPLAFLHGEGLVHRDLKPENIMVREDESPILVDFGLVADHGPSSREELTAVGALGGTPAYVAPEQIRGELVDARADLYSLGCILYELLTGRPPFLARSVSAVLLQHLQSEPEKPSLHNPSVAPGLDALTLRLLAKSPRERPGHADAVAAALESLGARPTVDDEECPRPRAYLYRPRFAGRGPLLESMRSKLAAARTGSGAVVLVRGESGIGKTRLALELSRMAGRDSTMVLVGRALPGPVSRTTPEQDPRSAASTLGKPSESESSERAAPLGGGPLHAMSEPLRAIGDRCRELGETETRRLLGRRGKLLARYESTLLGLPGLDDYPEPAQLDGDAERLRLFSYLSETLEALVERAEPEAPQRSSGRGAGTPIPRPEAAILLILDDLQWADDLTLEWLEFLQNGDQLRRAHLLVLALYRSEEAHDRLRKLEAGGESNRWDLGRLKDTAVADIVGDMLALDPAPERLSHFLSRQSEGNPFFVAEYLRATVDGGLLWRDQDGGWQVAERSEREASAEDYERLPLPRTIRELIARRLQDLPADAVELVSSAAVVGRDASLELLARMVALPDRSLSEALAELLRRQVLEEAQPGVLRFAHDKLREHAYGAIELRDRARLHQLAAEGIEESAGGVLDALWVVLGGHWEQAGITARAGECYLAAARTAAKNYALREAETLYRRCLSVAPELTESRLTARKELGADVLNRLGRSEEALTELQQLGEEARGIGSRVFEAKAIMNIGLIQDSTGNADASRASYAAALSLSREIRDENVEAATLHNMSHLEGREGLYANSRLHAEEALAIYRRIGTPAQQLLAMNNVGLVYSREGRWEAGIKLFAEVAEVAGRNGLRWQEALGLLNLGATEWDVAESPQALAHLERARTIFREIENPRGEALPMTALANIYGMSGHPEISRRLFAEAIELSRSVRDFDNTEGCARLHARLERLLGETDAALRLLKMAESILHPDKAPWRWLRWLCARGHLALVQGQPAASYFKEAADISGRLQLGQRTLDTRDLNRLRDAIEATEAGQTERLFRGELISSIPKGLRDWLIRTGNLDERQAQAALESGGKRRRATRTAVSGASGLRQEKHPGQARRKKRT